MAVRLLAAAAALLLALDLGLVLTRSGSSGTEPSPTPGAQPTAEVSPATLAEQIDRVAGRVAELRGLRSRGPPHVTYLTREELSQRAGDLVSGYSPEEAELDTRILTTLGAVPEGFDLRGTLTELLAEQVLGFYDPETGELVVGVEDRGRQLSPIEELTLAHELEHALADRVLGLPALEAEAGAEDAVFARRSLVEGDAQVVSQEYAATEFSLLEQMRLAGEALRLAPQVDAVSGLPHVLRRSLEFPYVEGAEFVARLRARGGWPSVDQAYRQPPESTAEILFPERFVAGETPIAPEDPGRPTGQGWRRLAVEALGAADLLLLFEAPGGDLTRALEDPRRRVRAWGGGVLHVWGRDSETALGIVVRRRPDADGLCDGLGVWYVSAFTDAVQVETVAGEALAFDGERQDASLRCGDREVRLGVAPDLTAARGLSGGPG